MILVAVYVIGLVATALLLFTPVSRDPWPSEFSWVLWFWPFLWLLKLLFILDPPR